MSMNLHCEEMDLWQTPTYITWMCFSNNDGGWKGILYRYTQWVNSSNNGISNTKEDEKRVRSNIEASKEHIKKLNKIAKKNKTLNFYVM